MSGWSLNDDGDGDSAARSDARLSKRESSVAAAAGGSFQVRKAHAFFAAEDDSADPLPTSSRRKQSSERMRELVLDDAEDGDEGDGDAEPQSTKSACSVKFATAAGGDAKQQLCPAPSISSRSANAEASAIPDVIHTRLRSKVSQSSASSSSPSDKKRVSLSEDTTLDTEALMHYLVREFLILHVAESAAATLFEKEQQHVKTLDEKSAKKMLQRVIGQLEPVSKSKEAPSLLEQLVVVWDEATHKRSCERLGAPPSASSSRRSSSSSRSASESAGATDAKKKVSSSIRKKKPALNVITAAEELDELDAYLTGDASEGDFNRLNHPGSTPKPQLPSPVAATILGDPGSTPKARASDLKTLGFDEDELRTPVPVENIGGDASLASSSPVSETAPDSATDAADDTGLSDYAKRKRVAKKHDKRVSLGVPGSTPTKEYVFFRETPPSYVTESVEAAVEVLEKLGLDPAFRLQAAAPQERFVELQSSEVAKYSVGQEVRGLGAQRNVSGVVSKVFGSRQCGTSGPGTIVIDTSPEETSDDSAAPPPKSVATRPATPAAPSAFNLDDEDLMDELVAL